MQNIGGTIRLVTVLGIMSTLSMVAAHLALTDIWHGEGDLGTEWAVVQISAVLIGAFHVAVWTLVRRFARGNGT